MLLRVATGVIAFVSLCAADSLTLRSGRVIDGQYLGGDARQVRMAVGDRVETFEVNDITSLQFGGAQRVSEARDRDRGAARAWRAGEAGRPGRRPRRPGAVRARDVRRRHPRRLELGPASRVRSGG